MLLTVDVGNTNTVLGLYEGRQLQHHFRIESARGRTADEYAALLRTMLDLRGVAPEVVTGAFRNSGQVCVATKRIFIHESIYDEFLAEMVSFTKKAMTVGSDPDGGTQPRIVSHTAQATLDGGRSVELLITKVEAR